MLTLVFFYLHVPVFILWSAVWELLFHKVWNFALKVKWYIFCLKVGNSLFFSDCVISRAGFRMFHTFIKKVSFLHTVVYVSKFTIKLTGWCSVALGQVLQLCLAYWDLMRFCFFFVVTQTFSFFFVVTQTPQELHTVTGPPDVTDRCLTPRFGGQHWLSRNQSVELLFWWSDWL